MRSTRLASLLASACLLGALSAHAIWPHPSKLDAGKDDAFVRLSGDLRFELAEGTDQSRVPADLTDAIEAAAKQAHSLDVWPLVPDRGESYRAGVEQAKLVASVRISVLELMTATTPNPCVPNKPMDVAVGTVVQPRSVQQPFGGRKNAVQPVDLTAEPKQTAPDNWFNPCSIASHAIRELNYNISSAKLNLETDKTAPADLGYLDAEAYRLSVPADGGSIQLTSYTALGALRGLQTLQQLIYTLPPKGDDAAAAQKFIRNVPIVVEDRPAYPYRGLLLDTARNWFDLATIRKLIDTMGFVKLNQLHWHATDTQSFPLALDDDADAQGGNGMQLSLLAERGSYGWTKVDGKNTRMVYTETDVRGIVEYAARRGVNVIIETDMPAHMLSGVDAIDGGSLMACPNEQAWENVAAEPPSGQLRLFTNTKASPAPDAATYKVPDNINRFVSSLLRKIATLSKSAYVSSGGDEPNFKCWNLTTEAEMEPYIAPFMQLVTNLTEASGKRGMVWEEMAVKFPKVAKTLAPNSLVEIWNDANNSRVALTNNPDVNIVLAPYSYFYLDCGSASFLGNYTSNTWCPYVSWQQTYSFDPSVTIANATKAGQDAKSVRNKFVGGEHAVWTETIDPTNLEGKVWPRAAAGAEVWWTGEEVAGKKRDKVEALPRMMDLRYRLVQMGVAAEPLQPLWCATRPGQCNWHG